MLKETFVKKKKLPDGITYDYGMFNKNKGVEILLNLTEDEDEIQTILDIIACIPPAILGLLIYIHF